MVTAANILMIAGSIGFLLIGLRLMSQAFQRFAGQGMRNTLAVLADNPLSGVATGTVLTGALQLSSASVILFVGLVNAGLITLRQSIPLIMGANIGTTIKALILSTIGFQFDIMRVAIPIVALSLVFIFSKDLKRRALGEIFVGFALLLLGLAFLKENLALLDQKSEIVGLIKSLGGNDVFSLLLFLIAGIILTVIVQSSSVAITITFTLISSGSIGFDQAAAMVLGDNIGTTVTANIAAIVGNTQAKRAAFSHFLFNFLGVLWVFPLLSFFTGFINWTVLQLRGEEMYTHLILMPLGLSLFHFFFNLFNTIILLNFRDWLITIINFVIKDRPKSSNWRKFMPSDKLSATNEFSILQAKKEISSLGKETATFFKMIPRFMFEKDEVNYKALHVSFTEMRHYLEMSGNELTSYLSQLNSEDLSSEAKYRASMMNRMVLKLKMISDACLRMQLILDEKNMTKVWFTPKQRINMTKMFNLVQESFRVMNENLGDDYKIARFEYADELELSINSLRDKLKQKSIEQVEKGKYSLEAANYYRDLFSLCEKIGDHIASINEMLKEIPYHNLSRI
jgi:phosphate:Na+ symporter